MTYAYRLDLTPAARRLSRAALRALIAAALCAPLGVLRAQWTLLDAGTTADLEAVHALDSLTVLICGKDGLLKRSADGGDSWTVPVTGYADDLNAFAFVDATTGFVAADDGTVLKTTDGGLTWTLLATGGTAENLGIVASASVVAVSGEDGSLYRSADGGLSWTAETSGTPRDLQDRALGPGGEELAVGDNGAMTRLGGATWSAWSDPSGSDLYAVGFAATGEAFAAGKDGGFLRSTDGGVSWSPGASAGTDLGGMHVEDASRAWVCGDGGAILRTDDAGLSWAADSTPVFSDLHGIHFADTEHGFAVGEGGVVLRRGPVAGPVDTTGGGGTDTTGGVDTTLSALAAGLPAGAGFWPNPAGTWIVLDPGRSAGPLTVRLLGLDGRRWAVWTLDGNPRRVDLPGGLPSGAALLRWSDAEGRPLGTTRLWHGAP